MMEANAAKRRGPKRSPRRGAVLVETAVVLIITMTFFFGIFEYGRLLMMRQLLDNAAREGARLAVVSTNNLATSDIQNCVTRRLAGQTLTNMSIQVYKADPSSGANIGEWTDAALGDCIAVAITGTYRPLIPRLTLVPTKLPMSAKAVMCSEAN
jgi:Flp pilus assembly protein TadG